MGNTGIKINSKILFKKIRSAGEFDMANMKTRQDDFDLLHKINLENAKPFSLEGQTYDCRVYLGDPRDVHEKQTKSDVYDGDTLHVVIIYLGIPHKFTIRLLGIDTPEMRPRWNKQVMDDDGNTTTIRISDEIHKLEKQAAVKSRNALKEYIWHKNLIVRFKKNDKFGGRILAELFVVGDTHAPISDTSGGTNLFNSKSVNSVNKWMIDNNHAVAYNGGKKKAFVAH